MYFSKKSQTGRYSRENKKIKITSADKWFSIFIRIRDITVGDFCLCITCGRGIHWKYEADCGHYATRNHPTTRFDEQNCHAQCKKCNNFGHGEQAKHGFAIDRLYGSGTAQGIIYKSEIRGQKIHSKESLKLLSKEYRVKARAEAQKKGVEI